MSKLKELETQLLSLKPSEQASIIRLLSNNLANTWEGIRKTRGDFFYEAGDIFTAKWANRIGNIPLIRLSEMYLTRAEGNFRAGGTPVGASALEDINRIRNRAGAKPFTTLSLTDILKERRFELAFEGHWIHDIKRNKQTILKKDGNGTRTWTFNSPKLVFPIPLREIDANKNLIQNEGYQ